MLKTTLMQEVNKQMTLNANDKGSLVNRLFDCLDCFVLDAFKLL